MGRNFYIQVFGGTRVTFEKIVHLVGEFSFDPPPISMFHADPTLKTLVTRFSSGYVEKVCAKVAPCILLCSKTRLRGSP